MKFYDFSRARNVSLISPGFPPVDHDRSLWRRLQVCVGGGAARSIFFSFLGSFFGKIGQNDRVTPPPLRLACPPLGTPGIATRSCCQQVPVFYTHLSPVALLSAAGSCVLHSSFSSGSAKCSRSLCFTLTFVQQLC